MGRLVVVRRLTVVVARLVGILVVGVGPGVVVTAVVVVEDVPVGVVGVVVVVASFKSWIWYCGLMFLTWAMILSMSSLSCRVDDLKNR